MLTNLAVLLCVASAAGAPMQRSDTVETIGQRVTLLDGTVDSTSARSGPRRALVQVAAGQETARQVRGIEASDSAPQRRRAIEHSDWYYRRLTIHKAASFATAPLFVAEYIVGQKLFDGNASSGEKSAHQALASGIGVLFGVNTITGGWNLWDSRHDTQGRARRLTHAALMFASEAGFVATAALAPEGEENEARREADSSGRNRHRTVAISSMGVSLVSYLMMYVWK
jgi:hypothetical protein